MVTAIPTRGGNVWKEGGSLKKERETKRRSKNYWEVVSSRRSERQKKAWGLETRFSTQRKRNPRGKRRSPGPQLSLSRKEKLIWCHRGTEGMTIRKGGRSVR